MKRLYVLIMLLFVTGILSACGWMYALGGDSSSSNFNIAKAGLAVPSFSFTNQDGEAYGSKQLEGEYWLSNMIFTNCPSVCPTMTPNMKRLQDAAKEEGIDLNIISFSVDPETDTPEQLKAYSEYYGAEEGNWHFLTGYNEAEIAEFADEAFGTIVQSLEDSDDIMHSTSFFLTDPEGNVIRKYDGMKADQSEIVSDLLKTVKK